MTHYSAALAIAAVVIAGCRSVPHQPPAACARPSGTPIQIDSVAVPALAGAYELVTVYTARGYGGHVARARLELAPSDSAHAVVERRTLRGVQRVWHPLTGVLVSANGGGKLLEEVGVGRGGLMVGCVECLDASPTSYRFTEVTADGFRGMWIDHQTGIGVAVDRHGRELPNPEGYFCARRIAP